MPSLKIPYSELDDLSGEPGSPPELPVPTASFSVVLAVAGIGALLLVLQIVNLAAVNHDKYRALSDLYSTFSITIPARRGLILDRTGNVIAGNTVGYDLLVDLRLLNQNQQQKSDTLQFLDELNLLQDFMDASAQTEGPTVLLHNIGQDAALKMKLAQDKYPALLVSDGWQRAYAGGAGFGNVIGYLGLPSKDEAAGGAPPNILIGKLGVERQHEQKLKGTDGSIVFERTATGQIIRKKEQNDPVEGSSVYLTLDKNLQERIYQIMQAYMEERGFKRGAVVLMKTDGEILSLVSYPSFDANVFTGKDQNAILNVLNNQNEPMFNKAISGLYSPGSTIKPIVAIAALAERIIDPLRKVVTNGYISIPNPYLPGQFTIFHDWRNNGTVDMREAIANSVNVYFYTIGGGYGDIAGLGINRLLTYYTRYGLGDETGIDLPGERAPVLPDPTKSSWRFGDIYNVSIGQGPFLVSPLRIALWTNAVATNALVRPYLTEKIESVKGTVLAQNSPHTVATNLADDQSLAVVREGMRMVVTNGSASLLNDLPVRIAGKTGTPQFSTGANVNAIFTGYFPYEHPQYVMTILIENVKLGSLVTLPLYHQIVQEIYAPVTASSTATTTPATTY